MTKSIGTKKIAVLGAFLTVFQMGCASSAERKIAFDSSGSTCSKESVTALLNKLFSSLGNDCDAYVSLFASDAKYYHQHDGYKTYSELPKNCQSYAQFCQGNDCKFLQNGDASVVVHGNSCQILVPYLWSERPANKGNLEPHTGLEYIIATPSGDSRYGYRIDSFAEHETTYSVGYNWSDPSDTPDLVTQSTLSLLKTTASKGECSNPIAPVLTKYFNDKSSAGETWRQQGDAVVLAAGGVCHVAAPYAAQVGAKLKTGNIVFTLQPAANGTYLTTDSVEFPRSTP